MRILQARGTTVSSGSTLLDLGCGSGHLVKAALARDIDAYGCDVDFDQPTYDQDVLVGLRATNRVRPIEMEKRDDSKRVMGLSPAAADFYRFPFDADMFDVVISNQVLEHVDNYAEMVAELQRVIKPGGVCLHMFPGPFVLIEGHTNIPFGGAFNPDWWLKLCAYSGVRMWHHKGKSARDTFAWTRDYLDHRVNYLSESELIKAFARSFDVHFVEDELFKINPRARIFLHPTLYRHFRGRILFGERRNNQD